MVRCNDCNRTIQYVREKGWFCERKNVNCFHKTVEEQLTGVEVLNRDKPRG